MTESERTRDRDAERGRRGGGEEDHDHGERWSNAIPCCIVADRFEVNQKRNKQLRTKMLRSEVFQQTVQILSPKNLQVLIDDADAHHINRDDIEDKEQLIERMAAQAYADSVLTNQR